jgi:hypothetical protein
MNQILLFILQHCMYLFSEYGFRFVDSLVSKSFGGDSYVVLERKELTLRFTLDRGQLFLDFRPTTGSKTRWYSIDLVIQMISGKVESSAVLSDSHAAFLKNNFRAIVDAFSDEHRSTSIEKLKILEKARAKRMFS